MFGFFNYYNFPSKKRLSALSSGLYRYNFCHNLGHMKGNPTALLCTVMKMLNLPRTKWRNLRGGLPFLCHKQSDFCEGDHNGIFFLFSIKIESLPLSTHTHTLAIALNLTLTVTMSIS